VCPETGVLDAQCLGVTTVKASTQAKGLLVPYLRYSVLSGVREVCKLPMGGELLWHGRRCSCPGAARLYLDALSEGHSVHKPLCPGSIQGCIIIWANLAWNACVSPCMHHSMAPYGPLTSTAACSRPPFKSLI
jgi:hypothetical protein